MRRVIFLVLVIISVYHSSPYANTWHATPHRLREIQLAIDLASPGDTVLVGPGEYRENLVMRDGVTLLGTKGQALTTLRPASEGQPIISCIDLSSAVTIKGFTLKRGFCNEGGGVYCLRSSVVIQQNRFLDCWAIYGGGVYCGRGTQGIIESNLFTGEGAFLGGGVLCLGCSPLIQGNTFTNLSTHAGGAICCTGGASPTIIGNTISATKCMDVGGGILCLNSSPVIESNTISGCYAFWGGAIGCKEGSSPLIIRNEIADNEARNHGGGISCQDNTSPVIEENRIRHNHSWSSGGGIWCWSNCTAELRTNVITSNSASLKGGGLQISSGSRIKCSQNTFWGNEATQGGSSVGLYDQSAVELSNCIIATSVGTTALYCDEGCTAISDCNDFWTNPSNYYGCSPGPNDFFECPQFCTSGRFDLDAQSPCADHPVCGQVGALGVGCGLESESRVIVPTTWGSIKARFR